MWILFASSLKYEQTDRHSWNDCIARPCTVLNFNVIGIELGIEICIHFHCQGVMKQKLDFGTCIVITGILQKSSLKFICLDVVTQSSCTQSEKIAQD